MGRGKFKGKPTGRRNFSTPEEIAAGTSGRPRSFKRNVAEAEEEEEEIEESEEEESEDDSEGKAKHKGTEGIIQIENPNLVKAKNIKAKEVDLGKTTELSRREREEIEKQKSHERYMKLQEQGKTEQAKKDLVHHNLCCGLCSYGHNIATRLAQSTLRTDTATKGVACHE